MVKPVKSETANVTKAPPRMGALERIAELEKVVPSLIQATNKGLQELGKAQSELDELIQSIAETIGVGKVQEVVDRRRTERELTQAEAARQQLEQLVSEGKAKLIDTVTQSSLLVAVESDADGKPVGPGRVQVAYAALLPEFKDVCLGKAAGFRFDTPSKTTLEILEIYEPTEVPAPVLMESDASAPAPQSAPAAESPPEAAAAAASEG